MLRKVILPLSVNGHMFLSSMPGRYELFEEAKDDICSNTIRYIVCLASSEEIENASLLYARALKSGTVPCTVIHFPMPDYGVASDRDGYLKLVREVAVKLQNGENILIHCGAGIGRTGTFAISVLLALGIELNRDTDLVATSGSYPEDLKAKRISVLGR